MLNTDLKLEETGQPQAGSIAVPEKKGTEEKFCHSDMKECSEGVSGSCASWLSGCV